MICLFIPFLLACFAQVRIRRDGIFENYLDCEQTTAIRGIFAILILFSHIRSYIDLSISRYDILFDCIISSLGQLIVVMFLFYSGYGVFCAYIRKQDYVKGFPKNRILKTLVHYDLAVFCFLILDIVLGITYEPVDYVFCWIGWKTIGHSKWFVFDILALYAVTWLMFVLIDILKVNDRKKWLTVMTSLGSAALIAFIYIMKRNDGSFWYNTILSYPLGMLFAYNKEKIDHLFKETKNVVWGVLYQF